MNQIKTRVRKFFDDSTVRLSLVLSFGAVQFAWCYQYYQIQLRGPGLLAVSEASFNIIGNLIQAVILIIPMCIGLLLFLFFSKGTIKEWFQLSEDSKKTGQIIKILLLIYGIELVLALFLKEDRVSLLFQWFYYLLFVSIFEEVTWRGMMPKLLDGKVNDEWVFLTPNILFALMHGALPLAQGTLRLIPFLQTDFIYFTALGLIFEWTKRKTGSLLVPVLLHSIFDFLFVLL